jgi:hypothetical protein
MKTQFRFPFAHSFIFNALCVPFKTMHLNQVINRLKIKSLVRQPFFLFHVVAATVVWVFVWQHAVIMDITQDEAYSFRLIKTGYYRGMPGTANTHWLNTFFMQLFMLFGKLPVYLRLQSIIAFPFFAHGIYRLATHIESNGLQFVFYCLAVLNPYVLDFFALARGYGMAITFQVWIVLLFIQTYKASFNFRHWLTIVILSALALASQLSYLYTVLSITGGFLLYCMVTDAPLAWYTSKPKRMITCLFAVLIFFSSADLLFIKYYGRDLEFGGRDLVQSIFVSFWNQSLYKAKYSSISLFLGWSSFLLVTAACLYFIIKSIQQKKLSAGLMAVVVIAGILILGIVFHLFFQTPYIKNRTAMQWYVPGLFIVCCAASEWIKQSTLLRAIINSLGLLTGIGVIFHCTQCATRNTCMEFYTQGNNGKFLYALYAQHPQHPMINDLISANYVNYYSLIDTFTPAPLSLKERAIKYKTAPISPSLLHSDYAIISAPFILRYLDSNHVRYTILKADPLSENKLIKIHH